MKVDFINRLTHEDIVELIPFYYVYDFEEVESTSDDTRKFMIQPTYDGAHEEVIIGNSYDDGTVRFYGVKEKDFVKFMIKKFGTEYFDWYRTRELDRMEKDIQEYSIKRREKCMKMISFAIEQI